MYLIGSRATNFWYSDFKIREDSDWDVVLTGEDRETIKLDNGSRVEFHSKNALNNDVIPMLSGPLSSMFKTSIPGTDLKVSVINPLGLAAILRSHLHRYRKFSKNMQQYQMLPHTFTCNQLSFIEERKRLTLLAYGDDAFSKEMSNEDFFTNGVDQKIDHDRVHEVITAYPEPLYIQLKPDLGKAAYCDERWKALSFEMKLDVIREECCTIAIERKLVPYALEGKRFPYRMAYMYALEKACTTLDQGLMREFSIDNWSILTEQDYSVFDKFFNSDLWKECENDYSNSGRSGRSD